MTTDSQLKDLQAKNERLRAKLVMAHEALEFYANVIKLEGCVSEGGIAREVLAATSEDVERWKADLQADVIRACVALIEEQGPSNVSCDASEFHTGIKYINRTINALQSILSRQDNPNA